jgi:hypothetical protein
MWSTFKDIAHHTCDLHSKILLITNVIYIQRYCSSHMWSTFRDIAHHTCGLHSKILLITHVIYIQRYCSSQMWFTFKEIAHHKCDLHSKILFITQVSKVYGILKVFFLLFLCFFENGIFILIIYNYVIKNWFTFTKFSNALIRMAY